MKINGKSWGQMKADGKAAWKQESAKLKAEAVAMRPQRESDKAKLREEFKDVKKSFQFAGKTASRGFLLPLILGIVGLITFPLGIIFWLFGLYFLLAPVKK
jgi:hypothetical protein